MASLAIDTFWNFTREPGITATQIRAGSYFRISRVAGNTFILDLAAKVRLVRMIESRVHGPGSAALGVPGERQFK
jgi:hypothetical protein